MPVFFRRFLAAALIYGLVFSFLATLHDYPQLRYQLHKTRLHDPATEKRQWLLFFYLINEAGSGLKFLLTGDERHMAYFPSASHILAAREAKALGGDFHMQIKVAKMHFRGEKTPRNLQKSLYWLRLARDTAPTPQQAQLAAQLLERVSAAQ